MNKTYSLWIVVDGQEFEIEQTSPMTEDEAQANMKGMKEDGINGAWFGLTNGDMISVHKDRCNFYFLCKPTPYNKIKPYTN